MSPPPLKRTKKRSSLTAFKAGVEPPQEDCIESSSLSLTSLPDDIIFNCLIRVPRCYYQNLSSVSKTLRSLIHSPELHRLRSVLPNKPKDSVYILFHVDKTPVYIWFTLREIEKTTTKIQYRLVEYPSPIRSKFMYRSCTISVGPEIFFIGGYKRPSTKFWILDTLSGDLTKGPNMNVARTCEAVVENIDGKVYVMGGCDDDIQMEVFDPYSREWKVAESPKEKLQSMSRLRASVNGKFYMVKGEKIVVYDPRKGQRFKKVKMPRSRHGGGLFYMCAVADVLYCYYFTHGLMGFDAKLKVWRRVVGLEKLGVAIIHNAATVEYDGKLAIFWYGSTKKEIRCALIMLDLIGDVILGTIQWCGTVATMPDDYSFYKCLACSDD